jgi:hypothetical protein
LVQRGIVAQLLLGIGTGEAGPTDTMICQVTKNETPSFPLQLKD